MAFGEGVRKPGTIYSLGHECDLGGAAMNYSREEHGDAIVYHLLDERVTVINGVE